MADSASSTNDGSSEKSGFKTILLGSLMSIVLGMSGGFAVGYFTFVQMPDEKAATDATALTEQAPEGSQEHKTAADEGLATPAEGDYHKPSDGEAKPAEDGHGAAQTLAGNITLEPIVTNLADPEDMWIRLELILVSGEPLETDLVLQIHEDFFAFVHAMRLSEMTGPSALIDLKSELLARARQRSGDRIKKIYIKTLLFE